MKRMVLAQLLWVGAAHGAAAVPVSGVELEQAAQNYQQHCQSCHGVNRLGGAGPALLPESLSRIKPDEIRSVIQNGRPASQMAAYSNVLNPAQIDAMVDYLQQPPATPPTWNDNDIRSSHTILADVSTLPSTPQHGADPLNLFVVVEAGNHHINILDGDRFEVLARFASHLPCMAGRSSRRTDALSISPPAMAGSVCMTCTT